MAAGPVAAAPAAAGPVAAAPVAAGPVAAGRVLGATVRGDVRDVHVVLPDGTAPPSGVPADMFAAAVAAYLAGRRLDMQSLARDLGVGRATLYRRAGNREQLLDEVIWWRGRRMVAGQLLATAPGFPPTARQARPSLTTPPATSSQTRRRTTRT